MKIAQQDSQPAMQTGGHTFDTVGHALKFVWPLHGDRRGELATPVSFDRYVDEVKRKATWALLLATSAISERTASRSWSGLSVSRSAITKRDLAQCRARAHIQHSAIELGAALQHRDHAGHTDARPGQAAHQRIELRACSLRQQS
jgi:Tfp pilus assembly protein PilE